jgi:alginate O-acetyltransferase complex protein AlgI
MLFNSFEFILFFVIFYVVYWFVFQKNIKWQNALLLAGGYIFYGSWDIRYLALLLASTVNDYSLALLINKYQEKNLKKIFLSLSIIANLGMLAYFKYVNFFIDSFNTLMNSFGISTSLPILNVILPIGISFYTFQSLAYVISVYRGNLKPTTDFIGFSAFICFFPQLVAGPIEHPGHLLGQFFIKREFSYDKAILASKQIVWGFFKKLVIADMCAENVNYVFNNYQELNASLLVLGAVYFAFQIYCDFSGYSDIALGTSRLLGFELTVNFKTPYFSATVGEFWSRWHITLSNWFKDYAYVPLGGGKLSTLKRYRNILIVFLLSGLWHGANWTFIIWGGLNALFMIGEQVVWKPLVALKDKNRFLRLFNIVLTFSLVTLAWIFFRSKNIYEAFDYIARIFSRSILSSPGNPNLKTTAIFMILLLLAVDYLNRKEYFQFVWRGYPRWIQLLFIYGAFASMMYFSKSQSSFIYFQF